MRFATLVGNSIKPDILPALDAGAAAIHVPARYEWDMEKAIEPTSNPRFFKAQGFKGLQGILAKM